MKKNPPNFRILAGLSLLMFLVAGCFSASAASITWTGLGGDPNYSTTGNWSPRAPVAGDALIFDGLNSLSPYNNLPGVTPFTGITFPATAAGFTLEGNAIELDGNLVNSGSSPQTINNPISLTNRITVDTTGDLTLASVTNTGGIIKTGTGALTIHNKTYAGGTTVNAGTVAVENDNGSYIMSGGALKLNYRSWWSGPTISFTADAEVGTDVSIGTGGDPIGIDFAGTMGSPGFRWTKTGSGSMYITHYTSDGGPTMVVQASAITVAEGLLANLPGGGAIARWGSNTVITVNNGAALAACDGTTALNPIILNGGEGSGQGVLFTTKRNNGDATYTNSFLNTITLNDSSVIGTFMGKLFLLGNITGPGGLTKIGTADGNSANLLVLGGTNTYGGETIINTGIVQLASSYALPGGATNGNITLNGDTHLDLAGFDATINGLSDDTTRAQIIDNTSPNPSTLTFGGRNQGVTFVGTVRNSGGGPLSIVKIGTSPATLMGANTYSGSNVVYGGKLEINIPTATTTGNGPVVIADGAELSLHYRIAASSVKATGVTLGFSGGTTLAVDLAAYGNPPVPVINATSGGGVLSANGTITVNLAGDSSVMAIGQFPLIKYKSRTGNGTFVLGSIPENVTAQIVTNVANSSIDVRVITAPVTKWVGNVNNVWDTTTVNWSRLGSPIAYADGMGVLFDDSGAGTAIDLSTGVSPLATLVSANKDYTFAGLGALFGGALTKSGSGKLTLLTGNLYGDTTIAGGTLQVDTNGTTATLGTGNIGLDGTLIMNRSDAVSIDNLISGIGTLVQQGSGTLTLNAANTFSGGTIINGGLVRLANASALGFPLGATPLATVATGTALDIGGQGPAPTNAVIITGPGVGANQGAIFNSGNGSWHYGPQVGIQTVQLAGDAAIGDDGGLWFLGWNHIGGLAGNGHVLTKVGTGTIEVRANALSSPSQVIVAAGGFNFWKNNPFGTATIVLTNGSFVNTWDQPNWNGFTIGNNFVIGPGGGQILNTINSDWNHGDWDTYTGAITLNGTLTVAVSSQYQNSGNAGRTTIAGVISGSGQLVKAGPYVLTLTGRNTYTGLTTVSNGTLVISSVSQAGGGYVVSDGATLDVMPQVGYPNVPMSSLTIGSSTGAVLSLARFATLAAANPPIVAGSLSLVGQNQLSVPASLLAAPGQYQLIKYTGTVSGGGSFVAPAARGLSAYFSNNVASSTIDLVVAPANPVYWVGNLNNLWDIGSTANFSYLGSATTYQENAGLGDAVTFNDSASVTTVEIAAQVSPTLVTVSNVTKDFTFTNASIAGPGSLLKQGAGTLTLNNGTNTFTGGTSVSGGTLRLGSAGSVNTAGMVTVGSGGTLDINAMDIRNVTVNIAGVGAGGLGAMGNFSSGDSQNGPGTINMTASATIGGGKEFDLRFGAKTLNCPTNAYSLTKVGSSTIKFANNPVISPNLGDIYILGGRLGFEGSAGYGDPTKAIYLGNGGQLGWWQSTVPCSKSIICSNGTAFAPYSGGGTANRQYNVVTGPVYLAEPGNPGNAATRVTILVNWQNAMTFSNAVSGPGAMWVEWNGDCTFAATNTFQGDFDTAGRVKLVGNASLNCTNNVTVNNGGSGVLALQDNAAINSPNLRIWAGASTNALIVAGNAAINSTFVQLGAIADFTGRSDGAWTLKSGQTLRMDNSGIVKGNVIAGNGSTFSPGGGYYIQNSGSLSNALTLQAGSTTYMDLSLDGGVTNNDAITIAGPLTYGGTLQLNRIGSTYLSAGNVFKLFKLTGAGTYNGSFDSIVANTPGQIVTWDTSRLAIDGTVRVASVVTTAPGTLTGLVLAGNKLVISWPQAYLGWDLLVQTNNLLHGVSPNLLDWGIVPGSASVTSVTNTIDAAKPAEFYRLMSPPLP